METLSLSEYQKICRICLKTDVLVSIYSPTFLIRPIEMLEKLHILKLPLDDTLPALLCQSCLYRLLDAYNLQQLADASERRLREYYGLPTSPFPVVSTAHNNELPNTDFMKESTDCSPVSMYANICDMFDRHDVTNDIVEVVGTDDVELLNDVEIDVSSLTRSEAEDTSLGNVCMPSKAKIPFESQLLGKNFENFKMEEQHHFTKKMPTLQKPPSRLKNTSKTPDICSECGKVFHYKGYLNIHKRVHSGEKPFKCMTCSREFITSNKLLLHQRVHKANNDVNNINRGRMLQKPSSFSISKRFQCEICSAFFTTSSNLKEHRFTHVNQKEYKCKHCLVAFKSPRDLKRHEPTHKTIRDIHCKLCEKTFTKRTSLNAHMITVHRRIRKHKCSECDKTFDKKSNLTNHVRIHSGEKPFECIYCSWKFAQSSALKRHTKKHMNSSIQTHLESCK